ncbi:MAG: 1-acyl-sn-glycerol-3-phosphate acyltransferase [Acidobacteria bacterium]|nr:1-acyl-sn-glycerol-3-phosphate acyltransferase [Acidobacteriota bacterium]
MTAAPPQAPAAPLVPPGLREILAHPLPFQSHSWLNRAICRSIMALLGGRVLELHGLEHARPERDPFVLAINHNQKTEAVILPTMLIYHRGGKLIHFISDWNFQLIPIVRTVIRRSEVITLVVKDARPRILNVLKPLFHDPVPAFRRARRKIEAGAPVGVFIEGTVNRDRARLMAGHPGAARLSLETGAPVVAAGIRFPDVPPDRPVPESARMVLEIGPPMTPPAPERAGRPSPDEVRAWHDRVMREIARLSGKAWDPDSSRRGRK